MNLSSVALALLLVVLLAAQHGLAISPAPAQCKPSPGLTKAQCEKRMPLCARSNVPMKWTGPGCKDSNGKRLSDGGCQCKDYCGYQCKQACNKDRTCTWKNDACYYKGPEGSRGYPMPTCEIRD